MRQEPSRVCYSTFLDSERWTRFETRPGDIVVAMPYKAGTTWVLNIVLHLIFQDFRRRHIGDYAPWLDTRFVDFDEIASRLAAQTHRRVIKTHLAADCLPHDPELRYIFVGRDPRDIFISLWNHYTNLSDAFFEPPDDRALPPLPRPPDDILSFFDDWISRGFVDGETDGYPFWSCFRQAHTWWTMRNRPNVHFSHYANLLDDLGGEIARIAAFCGIECTPDACDRIAELCSFAAMKRDAATINASSERDLKGGAAAFIHKGQNGRWRGVLTPDRLVAYERVASAQLPAACKAWMETGRGRHLRVAWTGPAAANKEPRRREGPAAR